MAASTVVRAVDLAPEVYNPSEIKSADDLTYDLGNLAAFDEHPIDLVPFRENPEDYLYERALKNTTLLISKIFDLPSESSDVGRLAQLPPASTAIPRSKPLPKPKTETRWEKFAKEKGIQKRKKTRMLFDEAKGEYAPSWGYKRTKDNTNDWVVEMKEGKDKFADPWKERKDAKKERVAKNLRHQQNNQLLRGAKGAAAAGLPKLPTGLPVDLISTGGKRGKEGTKKALQTAQFSTASQGKFDKKLDGEPDKKKGSRKRNRFDPVVPASDREKSRYESVLKQVLGKQGKPSKAPVKDSAPPKKKGKKSR